MILTSVSKYRHLKKVTNQEPTNLVLYIYVMFISLCNLTQRVSYSVKAYYDLTNLRLLKTSLINKLLAAQLKGIKRVLKW